MPGHEAQDEELNQNQEMGCLLSAPSIICPQPFSILSPDPARHGEMIDVKTEGAWRTSIKYQILWFPILRQIVYCSCFCCEWVWAMIGGNLLAHRTIWDLRCYPVWHVLSSYLKPFSPFTQIFMCFLFTPDPLELSWLTSSPLNLCYLLEESNYVAFWSSFQI